MFGGQYVLAIGRGSTLGFGAGARLEKRSFASGAGDRVGAMRARPSEGDIARPRFRRSTRGVDAATAALVDGGRVMRGNLEFGGANSGAVARAVGWAG